MKATDFVKTHGIKVTTNICNRYFDYTHVTNDARMLIDEDEYKKYAPHFADSLHDAVKIADLKRIVASHEFVKKYGWEHAKHALSNDAPIYVDLDYKALESLVKSYDLVQEFGGLIEARISQAINGNKRLLKAIADVEACK